MREFVAYFKSKLFFSVNFSYFVLKSRLIKKRFCALKFTLFKAEKL